MVEGKWGFGKNSIEWLVFFGRGLVDRAIMGAGDSVASEWQGSESIVLFRVASGRWPQVF